MRRRIAQAYDAFMTLARVAVRPAFFIFVAWQARAHNGAIVILLSWICFPGSAANLRPFRLASERRLRNA
jgi:hypothetical protein